MSIAYRASGVLDVEVGGVQARQPALLRRLMIVCPTTGLATDTGFELSAVPSVGARHQMLVDCIECGQDHPWHIDDAFME